MRVVLEQTQIARFLLHLDCHLVYMVGGMDQIDNAFMVVFLSVFFYATYNAVI